MLEAFVFLIGKKGLESIAIFLFHYKVAKYKSHFLNL